MKRNINRHVAGGHSVGLAPGGTSNVVFLIVNVLVGHNPPLSSALPLCIRLVQSAKCSL